jgi:uncharacterized membrane protein YhaH (DUF805 family)
VSVNFIHLIFKDMEKMKFYVREVFNKYAVFTGRARRSEYWYFFIFNVLIGIALGIIDSILFGHRMNVFSSIYNLFVLVPSLAVGIRRLHDIGNSGWLMLLCLIPIIGWIWLWILLATDSEPGKNQYGPHPKEVKEATLAKE